MTDDNAAITVAREALAPQGYTDAKLKLLHDTIAKGTSSEEFALFCSYVARTGLDPFAKQIYAIMRWDSRAKREVMSIQTGIDGYRAIAQDTGQYGGRSKPTYGPACECEMAEGYAHPTTAAISVKKVINGLIVETEAEVDFHEYLQTNKDGKPAGLWKTMPKNQLAKCAEAQALRAAFPKQLSGIYTTEEMGQADNSVPVAIVQDSPLQIEDNGRTVDSETGEVLPFSEQSVEDDFVEPEPEQPAIGRIAMVQYIHHCWAENGEAEIQQRKWLKKHYDSDNLDNGDLSTDVVKTMFDGWQERKAKEPAQEALVV